MIVPSACERDEICSTSGHRFAERGRQVSPGVGLEAAI